MKKLLLSILLFLATLPAYANSALTYFTGSDAYGPIASEDCPIIVEHEDLVLTLQDFPLDFYGLDADIMSYNGTLSATYTFTNPTDTSIDATLSFPLGDSPYYYEYPQIAYSAEEMARYHVSCNNVDIPTTLRYTYVKDNFSLARDLPLLQDDYVDDVFIHRDTPVTSYTYRFTCTEKNDNNLFWMDCPMTVHPQERRILASDFNGLSQTNDTITLMLSTNEETDATFYVLGKDFDTPPQWQAHNGETPMSKGEGTLVHKTTMTFEDFVLSHKTQTFPITDIDWYNAWVTTCKKNTPCIEEYNPELFLMCWIQYNLHFEPNETLTNNVTAPIYPDIDTSYEPHKYTYNYLLSPASTWKDFGSLDIDIVTDSFMSDSELGEFTKTDSGYTKSFDSLPEKELKFSLCTSQTPTQRKNNYVLTILLFLFFIGFIPFILIVLLIVFLVKRHKKKQIL